MEGVKTFLEALFSYTLVIREEQLPSRYVAEGSRTIQSSANRVDYVLEVQGRDTPVPARVLCEAKCPTVLGSCTMLDNAQNEIPYVGRYSSTVFAKLMIKVNSFPPTLPPDLNT